MSEIKRGNWPKKTTTRKTLLPTQGGVGARRHPPRILLRARYCSASASDTHAPSLRSHRLCWGSDNKCTPVFSLFHAGCPGSIPKQRIKVFPNHPSPLSLRHEGEQVSELQRLQEATASIKGRFVLTLGGTD